MTRSAPTLHMLCGKIASGKSTLAATLAHGERTVVIAEDDWLAALFAEEMTTGADYRRCASKLRGIMGPHVAALLKAGVSVILDFPANTVESRAWMHDVLAATGAAHQFHVITASDELCLERLRRRNAAGDHPFAATEEQFRRFSAYYDPPSPDEGFTIVVHDAES